MNATAKPVSHTPAVLLKAKIKADIVDVPRRLVIARTGAGDPDGEAFETALGALYGIAYTMRFARKKSELPEYKVGTLEGEWSAQGDDLPAEGVPPRESWLWQVQLAVPNDTTPQELQDAIVAATTKKRGKLEGSEEAKLVELIERPARRFGRILHKGPYADEPESFARIAELLDDEGLKRERWHIEVYLSDPRRTAPEKLKTTLLAPLVDNA